jgi:hypothetical protein
MDESALPSNKSGGGAAFFNYSTLFAMYSKTQRRRAAAPFLLLFCCLFTACQGTYTEPEPPCSGGYALIDGACRCPEGSYEANGFCRPLRKNEYYGIATECGCNDSIFFEITEPYYDEGRIWAHVYTVSERTPASGSLMLYFYSSDGDSLSGEFYTNYCEIKDKPVVWQVQAKKIGTDSLRMDVQYIWNHSEPPSVLDSCSFYLHR